MTYLAADDRYTKHPYRRCGRSGLKLPEVSLGLWQNFGDGSPLDAQRAILRRAFDLGVTHFDLANNYGPPPGSAEINFGRIFAEDFRPYRDELVISTKAGYGMWPGPYGESGSRKNLLAMLDHSLKRMGPQDGFGGQQPEPRQDPQPRPEPQRDRRQARPVRCPDGDLVGAARPAGHLSADRRQQRGATGGEPRRRRQDGVHAGGNRRDRPGRGRGGHQHLGRLQR